ncbi:hypothetical protein THAOC_36892, partial [Thalassiosira oceanica]
ADDALQSIELSASNFNEGMASPSYSRVEVDTDYGGAAIHSVLTAPLTAFTPTPTSVDCFRRTYDVDNDNLDEDDVTPFKLREDDVSPITQRNDVHPLQSVFAAPVLAFQLAPDELFSCVTRALKEPHATLSSTVR